MAVFRVHKNANYTVMSNYHFKERKMTLKAKGLLSLMLSLPEDWDYSAAGLVTLSKDGKDGVNAALKELEKFGFLKRTQAIDESGKFSGYDYEIYEIPQDIVDAPFAEIPNTENPFAENPSTEKPITENPPQLNTHSLSTKKSTTKKSNKEGIKKESYGTFDNVLLTSAEFVKLNNDFNNILEAIDYLSAYIEENPKYAKKNHNLALRRWVFDAVKEKHIKQVELEQREKRAQEIAQKNSLHDLKSFYGSRDYEREYKPDEANAFMSTNFDDIKL